MGLSGRRFGVVLRGPGGYPAPPGFSSPFGPPRGHPRGGSWGDLRPKLAPDFGHEGAQQCFTSNLEKNDILDALGNPILNGLGAI